MPGQTYKTGCKIRIQWHRQRWAVVGGWLTVWAAEKCHYTESNIGSGTYISAEEN